MIEYSANFINDPGCLDSGSYLLLKSRVMKCWLVVILLLKCTSLLCLPPSTQFSLSSGQALIKLVHSPLPSGSQMLYSSYHCIRLRLSPNYALSISVILCALSARPSSLILASDGLVRKLAKIAIIRTMVRRPVHSIRSTGRVRVPPPPL